MAKVSPVSIKYMIYLSFRAEGPLEKPDVIGAIFGQTEGLLGEELEMRELQKEGKIGRIEVELEIVDGKSIGEIQVPSALDKSETSLIAAALETIDKIGPTEAKIKVERIQDVRADKRSFIVDRAKQLLSQVESGGEIGELAQSVKEESRIAKIQEYGEERLPAGDISGDEVIVVEGRADVINLLRNRVNNVIGMNGTKLPAEIARLGEEKELTLFIDGDRGGKLIAMNVIKNAKISYVAIAPDGKEVEELQGKEILIALRRKVPTREYIKREGKEMFNGDYEAKESETEISPTFSGDAKTAIKDAYEKIRGTKSVVLVDSNFDVIRKVSQREITKSLKNTNKKVFVVIIDGNASSVIIRACEEAGVQYLGAVNFSSNIEDVKINLVSL